MYRRDGHSPNRFRLNFQNQSITLPIFAQYKIAVPNGYYPAAIRNPA